MGGELLASLELGGGFVIVEVVGVGRLRGSHSAMVRDCLLSAAMS